MRRLLAALAAAVVTVPVAASAASPSAGLSAPVAPSICSWAAKTEPDTVNVAFPDTNAAYWSHPYVAAPGTKLIVRGTYAQARYFSFNIYQPSAVPLDSIYDAQIRPDKGSANPFDGTVPAPKTGRKWTFTVEFTKKPATPAPNTIYAGTSELFGTPNPGGILMLRVYMPNDPKSPTGGVPLPTVETVTSTGTVLTADKPCSTDLPQTGGGVTRTLNTSNFPANTTPNAATPELSWGRAFGNPYFGFFGNEQNAYITTGVNRGYGSLVVVRAKAPRFPNTITGKRVSSRDQVRYWSLCMNSISTRVNSCAADYQTSLDADGYFTYVISDPGQRPVNATTKHATTWLPWGAADVQGVLIYRNMTPSPDFDHAAQNIETKDQDPATVMREYYPRATYCDRPTYEQGGWKLCFKTFGKGA